MIWSNSNSASFLHGSLKYGYINNQFLGTLLFLCYHMYVSSHYYSIIVISVSLYY